MRAMLIVGAVAAIAGQSPARPTAQIVDTPSVKILEGLTAPEFEAEMQQMNVALGVACGFCHVRGNFSSEENPRKATTDESRLGRVTCYTCHQGEAVGLRA